MPLTLEFICEDSYRACDHLSAMSSNNSRSFVDQRFYWDLLLSGQKRLAEYVFPVSCASFILAFVLVPVGRRDVDSRLGQRYSSDVRPRLEASPLRHLQFVYHWTLSSRSE